MVIPKVVALTKVHSPTDWVTSFMRFPRGYKKLDFLKYFMTCMYHLCLPPLCTSPVCLFWVHSFDQEICTYVRITLCTPEKRRFFPLPLPIFTSR